MNCEAKRIFVLLHGTFAPNSQWTIDSVLRRRLSKLGNVEFHSPQWPGIFGSRLNNGHRSRLAGAKIVESKLRKLRARNPTARIYLIAHSHAGNVAIYAARRLPPDTVNGIVCISTPFFHVGIDPSMPAFVASRFALVDNLLVLPWLALVLAVLVTVGLYLGIAAVAAFIGSLVPPGFESTVASLVPSWLASVLVALTGLLCLAFLGASYYASIYVISELLIATEKVVVHAANHVSRLDFARLGSIPPPHVPCRWLFATSDEVARLFSTLNRVTRIARRASRVVLGVLGTGGALALSIFVYGVQRPESGAAAWVFSGWTFVLSGLALYVLLGLVGFLTSRALLFARSLFMGWEGVLTTLFTAIEIDPYPSSHKHEIRTESLVGAIAHHSGRAFAVTGPWWRLRHFLYVDRRAIRDITESIKVFEQVPHTKCEACATRELEPLRTERERGAFRGTDVVIGNRRTPIHHL